jgi:ADP-ribose pyrophosphatase
MFAMKWLSLFCLITSLSFAQGDRLDTYFDYLDRYPATLGPWGDAAQGEIEIIRDRKKIAEVEQQTGRVVGVVALDKYWIWLNDVVKFPKGNYGVYSRLLWLKSLTGPAGVAVMPILPNGKVPLNRTFRHATRSWEYELPRGLIHPNEAVEDAARREVKEETGMLVDQLHFLGQMTPDSGITCTVVPVYFAKVVRRESATPEDSEAIASIDSFSIAELKQGFINGYLTIELEGKKHRIPLRDPFLAFALFQAEIRSLL